MAVESPATERSRRTRGGLVQATHDEVARTGQRDVAAIAPTAGVTPATFYAHFDTHDDASADAVSISLSLVVDSLERNFSVEALLDKGLASVAEGLIRDLVAVFGVEALVMRTAVARIPHDRGMRDVYRNHEVASREHLTRHIELGQRAGMLRAGDPEERAKAMLVVTQGLNNPLLFGKAVPEALIDDLGRAAIAVLAP